MKWCVPRSDYIHEERVGGPGFFRSTGARIFCARPCIDVWEGMSGTSADIPRFGLEIYSVSNAILDIFKNKFYEIEDLTLFTDKI